MSDIIETIEKGNYKINIYYDNSGAGDPRCWDNLGTIYCFSSRMNIGDKHEYSNPDEFLEDLSETSYPYEDQREYHDELMEIISKKYVIKRVYKYEHSGVALSTKPFSCPWDSGPIGFIFASKEKIRDEFNCKNVSKKILEKTFRIFDIEIEEYSKWVDGQVYRYEVMRLDDEDGNVEEEFIDSCGGFLGYDHEESGLIENAEDIIEYDRQQQLSERIEQVKTYIRNKVPLQNRVSFQL